MTPEERLAWNATAELEANTLQHLLQRPDNKVLVVVVSSERDGVAASLLRAVSANCNRHDAVNFIGGLKREVDRLAEAAGLDPNYWDYRVGK